MKTTTFRSRAVTMILAGALVAPALLAAQRQDSTAARTYVVRPGDTLWHIALETLGDGHRWREIVRLNRGRIPSPPRVAVGVRLVLPPRARTRGEIASAAGRPVAQKGAATDTSARKRAVAVGNRKVTTDTILPPAGATRPSGHSIFFVPSPSVPLGDTSAAAASDTLKLEAPASVRPWEYISAPFVASADAFRGAGHCVSITASQGTVAGQSSVDRIGDRMTLVAPRGVAADAGMRILVARRGPVLDDVGTILIPTGVVRIAGRTSPQDAEVIAQFDALSCEDVLVAFELPRDVSQQRPAAVTSGPAGKVVWVASTAVLPSLQHHVVTNLGSAVGVKPGDQITLFSSASPDSIGARPLEAAVATVLRVGPHASTALIIHQTRAAIAPGTTARVTAKLP